MTEVVWLASYPKSGNTWFRALWTNYHLLRGGAPRPWDAEDGDDEVAGDPGGPEEGGAPGFSINRMRSTPIASGRSLLDDELPFDTANLTPDELDLVRPHALRAVAGRDGPRPLVFKVHDAFQRNARGEAAFPPDVTRCAVYLVRNPLDVCVSYAHHNGCTVERALRMMNDPGHAMAAQPDRLNRQARQFLGTWSAHVRSWVDEAPFPVNVVRYEDLKRDPGSMFARALRAMGVEPDPARVAGAVEASRFEKLRAQEAAHGFREKNPRGGLFFRRGRVGGWQDEMTLAQAKRLVAVHGATMQRLGYPTDLLAPAEADAPPAIPIPTQPLRKAP